MAEETWSWREQPLLEYATELERTGELARLKPRAHVFADALGLQEDDVTLGLGALIDARYIVAVDTRAGGGKRIIRVTGLTEKARRATGQWPSADPFSSLVQLLEARIADTADPEVKSKLRAFRDAVLGIGSGVATSVLAELIKRQAGI